MWTRRPIVKVAMGCRTEPAAVHIAHVLQRLDFFQFFNFFYNLHDLQQKKKLHDLPQKLKNSIFFYNSHDLQQKKKITRIYSIKKNYTTIRFFCTRLTFFAVGTGRAVGVNYIGNGQLGAVWSTPNHCRAQAIEWNLGAFW